jgi:hypothetical protein
MAASGTPCALKGIWHGPKHLSKGSFGKHKTSFDLVTTIQSRTHSHQGVPIMKNPLLEAGSQAAAVQGTLD